MPIRVSCDHCGRSYKMKSKLAGQRFRCKNCACVIHIPAAEADNTGATVEENDDPDDETSSSQTLPIGSGVGLPPRSESTWSYPRSLSSRSSSVLQVLKGRSPWRTLAGSTIALLIVAAIITSRGNNHEPSPQTNEKPTQPSASTHDTVSEDELADIQNLIDDELTPENLTLSLADVLEDVRQQDAAMNPPWQDFSFPEQPISILMPGNPQPVLRQQGGITIRGAAVELASELGGKYSILFINYKVASGETIDVGRHFEGTKQGLLNSIPFGQLSDERAVSITDEGGNEHPGREFRIDGDVFGKKMRYLYRIYMVGTRMIILFTGVEQPHATEFQANSMKFLDSLQVTASIPPVNSGK